MGTRNPVAHLLVQRTAITKSRIEPVKIARTDAYIASLIGGRANRHQIDRATGGIAAIKRALRPFQHLYALQIIEHETRLDIGRQKYAIRINRRRRRRQRLMVHRANSPDLERHLRAIGNRRLNPGYKVGQVARPQKGRGKLQPLTIQYRHRGRQVRHWLFKPRHRHGYRVQSAVSADIILRDRKSSTRKDGGTQKHVYILH